MRSFVHYFLHFAAPIYLVKFENNRLKSWFIYFFAMVIDFDHLFADPMFDPNRISIGFHPLHTFPASFLWAVLIFSKNFRILGFAVLFHLFTDCVDGILIV
jgi:hypothetical protein